MASSSNVRNAREICEYFNRRFQFDLCGDLGTSGECEWVLPPLNEMGFSNNYSQALIQVSRVAITNESVAGITRVNNVFINTADNTISGAGAVSVELSIPCRQRAIQSNDFTEAGGFIRPDGQKQNFGQMVNLDAKPTPYLTNTAVDGKNPRGSLTIIEHGATAIPTFDVECSNTGYFYESKKGVEEGGLLCANPFGTQVRLSLRNHVNKRITLGSGTDLTADNGKQGKINITLDILMLENAVPTNR
jgi:hypothetical protein